MPVWKRAPVMSEPRNLSRATPRHWFLLGRYWQYNLEDPDAQRALNAYRTSLSLDPRGASVWLDLATAYESRRRPRRRSRSVPASQACLSGFR